MTSLLIILLHNDTTGKPYSCDDFWRDFCCRKSWQKQCINAVFMTKEMMFWWLWISIPLQLLTFQPSLQIPFLQRSFIEDLVNRTPNNRFNFSSFHYCRQQSQKAGRMMERTEDDPPARLQSWNYVKKNRWWGESSQKGTRAMTRPTIPPTP